MNANQRGSAARCAAMIAMMLAAAATQAADGLPSTSSKSSVWSNSPDVSNRPVEAVAGKTRAQVRSELEQSIRSGEGVVGFTAMSARELDPARFARSEPNFAGVNASR